MVELKTSVGAFEAKTHLSNLLDRVERGDRIVITRHGREVAVLSPAKKRPSPRLAEIIERALAASKGTSLPKGMTIKDMINAGRKR
jgi:prevent-host-death family protein